jgi:hypothetical protein
MTLRTGTRSLSSPGQAAISPIPRRRPFSTWRPEKPLPLAAAHVLAASRAEHEPAGCQTREGRPRRLLHAPETPTGPLRFLGPALRHRHGRALNAVRAQAEPRSR